MNDHKEYFIPHPKGFVIPGIFCVINDPDGRALYLNTVTGNSELIGPRPYSSEQLKDAVKRLALRERT